MSFWENLQKNLAEGVEAGKDLLAKAAEKAKEAGEIGTTKWEIFQLSSQVEKSAAKLGAEIYARARDHKVSTIDPLDPVLKALMDEISALKDRIEALEKKLKGDQ